MDKVDGYGHDYGYSPGDEKRLRLVSHLDSFSVWSLVLTGLMRRVRRLVKHVK